MYIRSAIELGRLQLAQSQLRAWLEAFAKYKEAHPEDAASGAEKRAVALLEMLLRLCNIEMQADWQGGPLQWDSYQRDYSNIVDYAENAISVDDSGEERATPHFQLHTGVMAGLYSVITRCRDPIIRRRALFLLRTRRAREGFWDSQWITQLVVKVIKIEEDQRVPVSCRDIPLESRISRIEARDSGDGQYLVGLKTDTGWIWEPIDRF